MRTSSVSWRVLAAFVVLIPTAAAARGAGPKGPPHDLAALVWAMTDAVLTQHVEPPTRQQMIGAGLKAAYEAAHRPVPQPLARDISSVVSAEQLAALLDRYWPVPEDRPNEPAPDLSEAMTDGALSAVRGGARLIPAKELKVTESFAGNLYVGIHVALGTNKEQGRPDFQEIFPDGPAGRAGIKKGDVLVSVEGEPTKGKPLTEVVDRLRGPEGTMVTVGVKTPPSDEVRTLTLRRGLLPRATAGGVRKRPGGGYDVCLDAKGAGPVGYVRVTEISGSTPGELRTLARQMEDEGARALVLDLRGAHTGSLHATVLLADALLDGGTIGRVRGEGREVTFEAEPDAVFRGRPMAVLVDRTTAPAVAWLAAALQDNRRALVVGEPTVAVSGVQAPVPILGGAYSVTMTTGTLLRGDGRPMGDALPPEAVPLDDRGMMIAMRDAGRLRADRVPPPDAGGVKPDEVVAPRPQPAGPNPGRPATTLQEAGGAADDPVVARAVERLRRRIEIL
jgi:carboxyl-terminal processing protease